jgi:hypothetical protein
MATKFFTVTPDYPSEPYGLYISRRINPLLDDFTHFIVLDGDMAVGDEFWQLPEKYPDSDIVTVHVIPKSKVYLWWERLTYWIRIGNRDRGQAVIYSSKFLKSLGGYPSISDAPDTWLLERAGNITRSNVRVLHMQRFNPKASFWRQIRDGQARAWHKYPIWRTILHSILRLRPVVLFAFAWYRVKGVKDDAGQGDTVFRKKWKERRK